MPKGRYQRKARMQPETMAAQGEIRPGAVPEMTPEPTADAAFQSTVLTLLESMQAGLAALSSRVDKVEGQGPRFIKRGIEEYEPVEAFGDKQSAMREEVPPDGQARFQKIPTFSDGLQVHELVMAQFEPRFRETQRVRLNLDIVPHGRADEMTRRELKIDDGTPDGVGEIISLQFMSKQPRHGWKYRCKFDKKVLTGSNGGVSSFYEWELLPA